MTISLWAAHFQRKYKLVETALKRKKMENRRNKRQQKATVRGMANVTSSHDWGDCIYSIYVGFLSYSPFLSSFPLPLSHGFHGHSATCQRAYKKPASTTTHHL